MMNDKGMGCLEVMLVLMAIAVIVALAGRMK